MSDVIQKLNEAFEKKKLELRKKRQAVRANAERLRVILSDVESIGGEPYTDGDWIFCPVNGDKTKFLALARLIRRHGFKMPEVEKGATGFTSLQIVGENETQVYVYFQFSSTACRRVKTGTKTVVQDVYETVCDEMLPYGEQPPIAAAAPDDMHF